MHWTIKRSLFSPEPCYMIVVFVIDNTNALSKLIYNKYTKNFFH